MKHGVGPVRRSPARAGSPLGGADPARGSGLIGLRDRAEALGGSLEVSSPPGKGTLIGVQLPLGLH
jgi:signal transduction histidine kinase